MHLFSLVRVYFHSFTFILTFTVLILTAHAQRFSQVCVYFHWYVFIFSRFTLDFNKQPKLKVIGNWKNQSTGYM